MSRRSMSAVDDLDAIERRLELLERRRQVGPADPLGRLEWLTLPDVPAGWIVADGTTVGATWPEYRQALIDAGSPYGFSSGNPHRPNLINRVVVGAGGTYALGASGGAATHTLTQGQMPSHTHTQNPHGHSLGASGSIMVWQGSSTASAGGSAITADGLTSIQNATATNQSTGGGEAHNNMPPYVGLLPIIRAY